MDSIYAIRKQLFVALCVNIGGILTGFSIAWSSPVVTKLQDPLQSPLSVELTLKEAGWVGSSLHIGATIGPYVGGIAANMFGRKKGLMLSGLIMVVGHVLLMFGQYLPCIFAGRAVAGFGAGMIYVNNLIYIGEMAATRIRGMILTSTGFFHGFGSLFVLIVGPYVSYTVLAIILLSISVLHVFGTFYIPESPVFHLINGREKEAIQTLHYLGRSDEIEDIKHIQSLTRDKEKNDWKFSELFTIKSNRKSLVIAFFTYSLQQAGGMLAALYFTATIFTTAGSAIDASISAIISGATLFVGTLLVPTIVERTGRKTLLLISTAGCCVSMTVLGVYFCLKRLEHPGISSIGWLPLACLMVMFFTFSIGLNIIPNTLVGELFRPNVRSIGSSLVITLGSLCGFISVSSFGYCVEYLGSDVVFWVYALLNAIGFVFILVVVPETKGLSLAEIQIRLS